MAVDRIKFIDRRGRDCELAKPYGAGGGSYHFTVNKYHYGEIVRQNGRWVAYPRTDELPTAYWDELVKWVENNEKTIQAAGKPPDSTL